VPYLDLKQQVLDKFNYSDKEREDKVKSRFSKASSTLIDDVYRKEEVSETKIVQEEAFIDFKGIMSELIDKWKISESSNMFNQEGSVTYHTYVRNLQKTLRRMLRPLQIRPNITENKKSL